MQPEGRTVLNHWLRAGWVVTISTTGTTIADGLGAGIPERVSTTYIGGLYEKRATAGSNLHVFNVAGVAQVEWPEAGGVIAPARINYLHSDHLGTRKQ